MFYKRTSISDWPGLLTLSIMSVGAIGELVMVAPLIKNAVLLGLPPLYWAIGLVIVWAVAALTACFLSELSPKQRVIMVLATVFLTVSGAVGFYDFGAALCNYGLFSLAFLT